jgi:multidrug transporter EmrE-like cation transporter
MNGLHTTSSNLGSQIEPQILGMVFLVFGTISLALGVAYLVMAYGLWKGKGWAIFSAVGIMAFELSIQAFFPSMVQVLWGYWKHMKRSLLGIPLGERTL